MPSARIWAHLEVEMTPQDIEAIFTRSDGRFAFARWGRPIAPVVFGVDDATLAVVKGAVEATCQLVRQPIVETDPELGSNLMMFFFREWAELGGCPAWTSWSRIWGLWWRGYRLLVPTNTGCFGSMPPERSRLVSCFCEWMSN